MKSLITGLLFLLMMHTVNGQVGTWTWVKGNKTGNNTGNYGTMGVPSATNEPPARYAPAQWVDTAGNFWIYGGSSVGNDIYSDLWKFDPVTHTWTWMFGPQGNNCEEPMCNNFRTFNPSVTPGNLGFGVMTWTTPDNHLWLFGGAQSDYQCWPWANRVNGLYQYDPAINQWACMSAAGPANYSGASVGNLYVRPEGRNESSTAWIDSLGNLWMFGGESDAGGFTNDLWKFSMDSLWWILIDGYFSPNHLGRYGYQYLPVGSYPPARATNMCWKDKDDNFWMVGGVQGTGFTTTFQDVWKFNPYTLAWSFMGGTGIDPRLPYGNTCVDDSSNIYGARYENRAIWKLCDNAIISLGGFRTSGGTGVSTVFNDLWVYKPYDNKWLKLAEYNNLGSYGVKGVANPSNYPRGRLGAVSFSDKNGNLWLFGGIDSTQEYLNDMWKLTLDTGCSGSFDCNNRCHLEPPVLTVQDSVVCEGESTQVCAPDGYSSYVWHNGNGSNCINSFGGSCAVVVTDSNNCKAVSNILYIPIISGLDTAEIIMHGDTLLAPPVQPGSTYQWLLYGVPIQGATGNFYVPHTSGMYTVEITGANGCKSRLVSYLIELGQEDLSAKNMVSIINNPTHNDWRLSVGSALIGAKLEVVDVNGKIVYQSIITNLQSEISFNAASGVYLLRVSSKKLTVLRKLIKI